MGCDLGLDFFQNLIHLLLQVDLTEYVEKHEFVFDAVLNEGVPNDEVSIWQDLVYLMIISKLALLHLILCYCRCTLRPWSP